MVRKKNRYVAFEMKPQDNSYKKNSLTIPNLGRTIIKTIQEIHGDYGVAATSNAFSIKYFGEDTHIAVVQARHGPHRFISSSIPLIKQINEQPVILRILYVGATLKKCYDFIAKYQRVQLWKFNGLLKSKRKLKESSDCVI